MKYGDVVLWEQIKLHSKNLKRSVLLITDDRKEDWWLQHRGKTIGPRPELVEEMKNFAGTQFYIYTSDRFLKHAQNTLGRPSDDALEEVREIRERDIDKANEALEYARGLIEKVNHRANWWNTGEYVMHYAFAPAAELRVFIALAQRESSHEELCALAGSNEVAAFSIDYLVRNGLAAHASGEPRNFSLTNLGRQVHANLMEMVDAGRFAALEAIQHTFIELAKTLSDKN